MKIDDILGFERPEVFKQLDKLNRDFDDFAKLTGIPKSEWQFHSSSIPELNAFKGLQISEINDVLRLIDSVTPLKYLPKFDADKFLVKVTGVQAIQNVVRVLNHARENETPESDIIDQLNALHSLDVDSCEISEDEARHLLSRILLLWEWAAKHKKSVFSSILGVVIGFFGGRALETVFPDKEAQRHYQLTEKIYEKLQLPQQCGIINIISENKNVP